MMSVHISSWCVHSVYTSVLEGYTQWMHQFLLVMRSMYWRDLFKFEIFTPMLSKCVRNWCICSGYASVPDVYDHWMYQFLMQMLRVCFSSWLVCSACFEGTFSNFIHAFRPCMSSWHICSKNTPVSDMYAQRIHRFLRHLLSAHISFLHICWGYTKWPFEKWENWCTCWACAEGTDGYAHGAYRFLTCMLSMCIYSWHVFSVCA